MKKFIIASLVLATTVFAQAAEVTILSTNLPASRGATDVEATFYIDTNMKEGFAKINVDEVITVMVRDCYGNYNGGYRGYPGHYPGYCNTMPRTQFRTLLTEKVKIEGMTMNGDEVIYQGTDGDVVCGTMGRSRILRTPTFFLSGKCELVGNIVSVGGSSRLTVTFKTK